MTDPQTVVSAEAAVLSYLLYRGQFEVPWHQRYYDWTTYEVQELLEDIDEAIRAGRRCYFLGAVMLVDRPGAPATWEINDGQQRMVTFSLMCARLARTFTNGADARREALALRVLFLLDENHTQTLEGAGSMTPRLSPPRDDQSRYNSLIRGDDIGTNGKLTAAWQVIDDYLAGKTLEQAQRFFDFMLNKLEIACLHVPGSIDPNAVFETLNARGRPLDDLDLIRNHLYSFFGEENDQARKETVHRNLESIRQHLSPTKMPEYVRCFFQCRYGFISSTRLYRETKRQISDEYGGLPPDDAVDYVYDLVGDLTRRERVELFHQITVPREDDEPGPSVSHRFEAVAAPPQPVRLSYGTEELQSCTAHSVRVARPVRPRRPVRKAGGGGSRAPEDAAPLLIRDAYGLRDPEVRAVSIREGFFRPGTPVDDSGYHRVRIADGHAARHGRTRRLRQPDLHPTDERGQLLRQHEG